MKAVIRYYDQYGDRRQATIEVEKDEPNAILVEAMRLKKIQPHEVVRTITCGRREYHWMDRAWAASGGAEKTFNLLRRT